MNTAILSILLVGAPWWYAVDAQSVVVGWQESEKAPPASSFSRAVAIRRGPSPEDIALKVGPYQTPGRACRWVWPEGQRMPVARDAAEIYDDGRDDRMKEWRSALRAYVEAKALAEEDPDAYTEKELAALKEAAAALKDEIGDR